MATIHQHNSDLNSSLQQSTPIFRAAVATSSLVIAPRIDRTSAGQALVRCDEPCSIAVDVTGYPLPEVTWHIGRRRIRDSTKYHTTVDGHRHILVVSRVTITLEKGIWIRASNEAGEDNCIIPVKTYKVFSGMRFSFEEGTVRQTACAPDVVLHRSATTRSKLRRPTSSLCSDDNQSAMSVPFAVETQDKWHREMALRNRMRSVDDLQQYKVWKMSDSSQSIDGTHSTSSGRRLRRVYVRRNRSVGNVTDQSSIDGDSCDGNNRSSRQRERRRKKTDTARSLSAAAPTVGPISGVASASLIGSSSSVDRKLRNSSADRRRDGGSITDNKTSKGINSTPRINGSADETGKRGTVKGISSSGAMTSLSVDVDARVLRPPTGRTSQLDRSLTSKMSKKKSTAESNSSLPVKHSQQVPSISSIELGTRRGAADAEQLSTAYQGDDDVWTMFGVRLGALVRTLLVSRGNYELSSEPSSLNDIENCPRRSTTIFADRRDPVALLRSPSCLSQTRAIDAAVLTLDTDSANGTGTTMLSQLADLQIDTDESFIDVVENPRNSVKLEYKFRTSVLDESLDGIYVASDTSTFVNGDNSQRLTEGKALGVDSQNVVERQADDCHRDRVDDVMIESGAFAEHDRSNCTYTNAKITICRPQDNGIDALFTDFPASWHQQNANSIDKNNMHAILSQTVDLQKILCTIDQLIGVGTDHESLRHWNAKFHAIDQHQPILESPKYSADSRPEVLDSADGRRRVVPTTVVKRGGVRVHSDGEDDGNELELDPESYYNDAGLSATLDLGSVMTAADNTDNDDDDFDSGEYEQDAEVHDLGVHPGKTSHSTLTLSDRFG